MAIVECPKVGVEEFAQLSTSAGAPGFDGSGGHAFELGDLLHAVPMHVGEENRAALRWREMVHRNSHSGRDIRARCGVTRHNAMGEGGRVIRAHQKLAFPVADDVDRSIMDDRAEPGGHRAVRPEGVRFFQDVATGAQQDFLGVVVAQRHSTSCRVKHRGVTREQHFQSSETVAAGGCAGDVVDEFNVMGSHI
ncbi:MAG: hypothetical protein Q4G37_02100 [Bifidobacterium sp.]|nr:hypothetical protein [Bifidobacterium sp.]